MALRFNGTTQFLSNSNAVIVTLPFTMAVRFNSDTTAVAQNLLGIYQGGTQNAHYMGTNVSGTCGVVSVGGGGSFAFAHTTNAFTAGVWSTLVGRYASASSREVILNADFANAATNGSTRNPVGLNTTAFGQYQGTFVDEFDGMACEMAFWSGVLSDDDVTAYDSGVSPLLIRPDSLVHYWPVIGKTSPEQDIISGFNFTLNNAPTTADHPRIYMPTRKKLYVIRTATRELSFGASMSRTVAMQREGQINRTNAVKRTAKKTTIASRLFALVLGHDADIDVNIPDLVAQAASAIVSRTVELSMTVIQGTRKFVGSAGLGLLLSPKTRWDRRRRRQ